MTDEHIFGQLAPIKSRGKRLLIDLEGQRCLESIKQEKFMSANGFLVSTMAKWVVIFSLLIFMQLLFRKIHLNYCEITGA